MTDSPHIINVTSENFDEVLQASFEVPVLMDFWAGWCQPCLMLMPVLASIAEAYEGKFLLAKVDTEEQQEIAARFGIRGIPNCKLFRDGQPIDEFTGALPESAVRAFLDKHVARESDTALATAESQLADGDAAAAVATLVQALESDPDNPRLPIALADAQAASGDTAAAEATLDALPANEQLRPEVTALRSRLFFETRLAGAPDTVKLETRLAGDENDNEARFQLALRHTVSGNYDAALERFLELMQKDRSYGDDAGRNGLLKVFELLGDDPRVGQYRRRMASLLH